MLLYSRYKGPNVPGKLLILIFHKQKCSVFLVNRSVKHRGSMVKRLMNPLNFVILGVVFPLSAQCPHVQNGGITSILNIIS